ncbi:cyclase family protein [Nocardioides halotolerans]|uniref:cyclase family protein n=1 Tax=Nocardioides halotolerans TaxID=433660 RepID=UPI00041BB308|nr:cyclase family protein [Nocardioides halotolerans]
MTLEPRQVTVAQVEALAEHLSAWGRWGEDDESGAVNEVTPGHVRAAAGLVRRGAVFSLSLPLDRRGPQGAGSGRANPEHLMVRDGGDIAASSRGMAGTDYTDDVLHTPLQAATHWDALCHCFYRGRTWNGRDTGSVASSGARATDITRLGHRAVGRGVLLDVPRWLGRAWLEPGEAIQAEHLEACAAAQGVDVTLGDFVLVRTGQMEQCRDRGEWGTYAAGPAPGLGVSAATFLCERGVVGVSTDTWGVEAIPYETGGLAAPLHVVLSIHAGIHLGEMWDLAELAADCATDRVFEFLLVAPPLRVTGAVGAPVHPVAIK